MVVLVVRPLCGSVALIGGRGSVGERAALAFYGIRGVGSFYYVAYALNEADFGDPGPLWATVTCIVVASIVIHGVTASIAFNRLDARRAETEGVRRA
ncbi:MAG: hypothetical protein Q8K63_01635 [Acidimicrobiales bacterium]|nr:hypothetical protein [Acidimicrobiales bacterium]